MSRRRWRARNVERYEMALTEAGRALAHGQYALLHSPDCAASRGGHCEGCAATLVGPAIRGDRQ